MKNSFLILATSLFLMSCTEAEKLSTSSLYIGTYTTGESEGIYQLQFDANTGTLSEKRLVAEMQNPSFLQFSPDSKYLYAVEETDTYDNSGGAVFAFAVVDHNLQLLNTRGTGGAHPCHVALSDNGKELAVSNYTGGNLALFTIDKTGRLNEDKQVIQHKAKDSTQTPHVHMAKFKGNAVFTADLGLDAIKHYVKKEGVYTYASETSLALAKAAGPRHFVFSKNEKFLYVINELNSSISTFKVGDDNSYTELNSIATLAKNFTGTNACADIHLSPDGRFLYGSNRGENTIVIFKVLPLTLQETTCLLPIKRAIILACFNEILKPEV